MTCRERGESAHLTAYREFPYHDHMPWGDEAPMVGERCPAGRFEDRCVFGQRHQPVAIDDPQQAGMVDPGKDFSRSQPEKTIILLVFRCSWLRELPVSPGTRERLDGIPGVPVRLNPAVEHLEHLANPPVFSPVVTQIRHKA